ncbi:NHLP family bacteriocin export ABC transporter permease/ATPase subunit [Actinoplanes philippinensis]|uniref:ATP-binding cassette, subfamily C n=2 Tax=Actinoplanes philippinensis TaxID=35752 RepID=A0A1I2BFU7_9ACTN|nr:ATP-binding cassette domain-containing protein [Actinoplanes philippinensis]GIE75889.1 NHLP family bacteriocin export ABC transporter permease/ATPase subunit [Actinoplanes philippinensis]SFE55072.1 ATP-binding cassette, subfamily C [Actinoplanes philippinensis]
MTVETVTGDGALLVVDAPSDLFLVRTRAGGARSRRHFVARIPVGGLVPDVAGAGVWRLLAVPLPGGRLDRLPAPADGAEAVDLALSALAGAVRGDREPPRDARALYAGQVEAAGPGSVFTGTPAVCWARGAGGRLVRNDGGPDETFEEGVPVLLAGRDWVRPERGGAVEACSSDDLLRSGELWTAVRDQTVRLLRLVERQGEAADAALLTSLTARERANRAAVSRATRIASGLVGARVTADRAVDGERLGRAVAALRLITGAGGPPIVEPAGRRAEPADLDEAVRAVARSSSLHLRDVQLPESWWKQDLGPLLGRRAEGGGTTVVCLVHRRGRYREVDPETGAVLASGRAAAAGVSRTATQVQRPLPVEASVPGVFRLGGAGGGADLAALAGCGVVVAALALAAPIVTGRVLGALAERVSMSGLTWSALLLVACGGVAALVGVATNLRMLRVEGRVEHGVQLVLWDRLMRLPVRFFRDTGSGELANTLLGVTFAREALSGVILLLLTSSLTALAMLALVWVLSPPLGLASTGLALAALLLVGVLGRVVIVRQRRALPAEHRAVSSAHQLISGISKIKLAGAEQRAFARWFEQTAYARSTLNRVRGVQAVLRAVATVLPIAGQLLLFTILAGPLAGTLAPDDFFALDVAFLMLVGALLVIVSGSVELLAALPRLAELRVVTAGVPERTPDRADPGDLRGEITLQEVTFGYGPDAPAVIDDVTLRVPAGAFVAIVGPSGCGKSTLLRLLLGFESPAQGSVYYDNQDLAELDLQAVRRQCGVVLQDGQLFAGTLRDNVCGAASYSLERVLEAARLAGLDDDIAHLPMGVATMVPHGGGTLSVGQRQRVLIARALIHRPRMIFFDEATSALDNRTQERVTESTRQLSATRLVIAHRLSTVRHADLIVVMDKGRIVQQGTFTALMAQKDGLFFQLARRQLVTGDE